MTPGTALSNQIRNALVDHGLFFRANVGRGWTGDVKRLNPTTVLIENARPFDTGLPPGFSDLFGATLHTVRPEDVGRRVALFTAIEVKAGRDRTNARQERFLEAIDVSGGLSGVARSVDDALLIVRHW